MATKMHSLYAPGGQRWNIHPSQRELFEKVIAEAYGMNPDITSLGGFNKRRKRTLGGKILPGMSVHSGGAAIDLKGLTPEQYRTLAKTYGLKWGGDFKNNYDPVHLEVPNANAIRDQYLSGEAGSVPAPNPVPDGVDKGAPLDGWDATVTQPGMDPKTRKAIAAALGSFGDNFENADTGIEAVEYKPPAPSNQIMGVAQAPTVTFLGKRKTPQRTALFQQMRA